MRSRAAFFIIVLLAALLNIGTTAGLIYLKGDKFNAAAGILEQKPMAVTLWSFKPTAINTMVLELKKEKESLDARETELGKLAAQIKSEKEELEKVRSDIEAMRNQISENIPRIEEAEAKNIKGLAKTYSSVKPTAAVAIFKELDDNTVVKILSFMKAETAGAILAEMSRQQDKDESMAKRAARISDKLRLLEPLQKSAPQT
jgi:flagellar motility protein MotE (MotC chaperone)